MKRKKITDLEKELDLLELRLNIYTEIREEIFTLGLNNYNNSDDIEELNLRLEIAKISCQRICRDLREQIPKLEENKRFMELIRKHGFQYYSSHFKGGF